MVLVDGVVGNVPGRAGVGAYTFSSLDSAERMLGYAGIYPVTDLPTLPGAPR